jgi:hypothetical protein
MQCQRSSETHTIVYQDIMGVRVYLTWEYGGRREPMPSVGFRVAHPVGLENGTGCFGQAKATADRPRHGG